MAEQPVPNVTRADVERIIRRDFPEDMFDDVLSLLDELDPSSDSHSPRVQLAVLKLAGGDLTALNRAMKDAKMDYRDVLAWAEFPEYMRTVPGPGQPMGVDRIIEADWNQYQAWLRR